MKLSEIQQALKVPKNNRNTFGNYNYRSAEDIIEAVKKIINPQGLALVITDDIIQVGNRIYIKATATIGEHSATGWAREDEQQKGMSSAQVTGSASSYARKYALNGLLAIDDTKDADATNNGSTEEETAPPPPPSKPTASKKAIEAACKRIKAGEKELYQKMKDQFTLEPTQVKDLLEAFAEPISKQLNSK
jgi:hypothetical protein